MNRAQFTSFLKSPAALTPESSKLLGEVLKEFPYCQTAHLLYVKSLHLQKSIHYNNQLKIAAAYATDRTILYNLITRSEKQTSSGVLPKESSRNEEQIIRDLELPEPVRKEEIIQPVSVIPPVPEAPKIPEAPLKKEPEVLQEIAPEAVKTGPVVPAIKADLKDEARIIEELPAKETESSAVEKETEPLKDSSEKTERGNNELLPSRKASPVPEPDNLVDPVNTDDTLKTVKDIETLTDTYLSTAIDASLQMEIKKEDSSKPPEGEEEVLPDNSDTELSFTQWLRKSTVTRKKGEEKAEEPVQEEKKLKETALIEKFIKEEPRIAKPQKEFYSPVNMARQSVVEDPDFVTETLATIYARQGNKSKAILAYQTLSLKYPKKKLYFASLIEKLESEA
jgi:hypothetical protein